MYSTREQPWSSLLQCSQHSHGTLFYCPCWIDLPVLLPHSLDTILPSHNCHNPLQQHHRNWQHGGSLAAIRCTENSARHYQAYLIILEAENKLQLQIKISLEKVGTVVSSESCQSLSASLPDILSFLTKQFQDGKQYRSLNCYRSAISSTHLPIEGFPIGKHPLITRLLIGTFNERPPLTKYASNWEVSTVLTCLSQLGQKKNPHVECSNKEA